MKTVYCLLFALSAASLALGKNIIVSIVPPAGAVAAGAEAQIDIVALNSGSAEAAFAPPPVLAGVVTAGPDSRPVQLRALAAAPATIEAHAYAVCSYRMTVPAAAAGRSILELSVPDVVVAPAVIDVRADSTAHSQVLARPLTSMTTVQPAVAAIERTIAGRLGPHEPIYFIYGPDAPAAKFQLSLKYRLLTFGEPTGSAVSRTLQLGFTQRSLWDVEATSSPFYDTSYMPELFYESLAPMPKSSDSWFNWIGYQTGYKHESNGRDGPSSRSLDIVYFRPVFALGALDRWHVIIMPEIFAYISSLGDNADLKNYRGYGQLRLVFGRNNGPSLMFTGRTGKNFDHPTMQLDFTVPLKVRVLDFGTYFLVQYFNGYGESLRSYSERSATVRAGIALVR